MILVRQVSRYIYDIFSGTGFDSWSRVRKQHWGVVAVAGLPINKTQSRELIKVINENPFGSVDAIAL